MNKLFPILAIETSGQLCSVALMLNDKNFVEINFLQKNIHSEKIMEMIDTVIRSAKVEMKQLSRLAISVGPGSFTGLRIGLSAAKGLAFGAGLPIVPVPTFDAWAYQIAEFLPDKTKFNIIVSASIDDVYFATFEKVESNVKVRKELSLMNKNELSAYIKENEHCLGNFSIKERPTNNYGPSAAAIARWSYLFGKDLLTFDYDYLEPNYFKKFIAKVNR